MALRENRVVVVTGASRGAGKGIALALAAKGATVYVTGRTRNEGEAALPGTVEATARACDARGGKGIAVYCDHSKDADVEALFRRVASEQGRLDILVNNATCVPDGMTEVGGFWEKPLALQDILDVGLRSSYVAAYYAAPLMVAQGQGLIVNTSSFGGRCYMHGPAYGAGKAGHDKMACDMAVDLRPHNVAALSLWMGLMTTERTLSVCAAEPDKYAAMLDSAETPEFSGLVIDALANDDALMQKSGKIWIAAELAASYGISDSNGRQPPSHASFLGQPAQVNPAVVE